MSITSEITRINNNIASAYTACNGKGATMPVTQNSANLATCISSIPAGGGSTISEINAYIFDDVLSTTLYTQGAQPILDIIVDGISDGIGGRSATFNNTTFNFKVFYDNNQMAICGWANSNGLCSFDAGSGNTAYLVVDYFEEFEEDGIRYYNIITDIYGSNSSNRYAIGSFEVVLSDEDPYSD